MKRLIVLAAVLLCSPAWSQGPPSGDDDAPPPERPTPDEIIDRLTSRLRQIDEMRAKLAAAIEKIHNGEAPADALGPGAMRMLMRRGGGGESWFAGTDRPDRLGIDRPGFDRPGPGPGGAGGPDAPTLDEVRAFIVEHLPELAKRLEEAEKSDPRRAERMVRRMMPRLGEMIRMEDRDPVFVELRVEEMRVGLRIIERMRALRGLVETGADNEKITAMKNEIRDLLARQYDLRDKLDAHRLEKMKADLEAGKARLEKRRAERDKLLDEHMQRVLDRMKRGDRGPGNPGGPRGPGQD